jgi:hypothetical protein
VSSVVKKGFGIPEADYIEIICEKMEKTREIVMETADRY